MNLHPFVVVVSLSAFLPVQVFGASCHAITGNEHLKPPQDQIRARNAAAFKAAGMTKILSFTNLGKCWNFTQFNNAIGGGFKRFGLTKSDNCIHIEDYGIGSFDVLKSNYCEKNSYILQLYDESVVAWRLYDVSKKAGGRPNPRLVAEFDKSGKKIAITIDLPEVGIPSKGNNSAGMGQDSSIPTSNVGTQDAVKNAAGNALKGLLGR